MDWGLGVEGPEFFPFGGNTVKDAGQVAEENFVTGNEGRGFKARFGGILPFELSGLKIDRVEDAFAVGDVNDSIDDDGRADDGDTFGIVGFVGPFKFVGRSGNRRSLAEEGAEALEAGGFGLGRCGGNEKEKQGEP